MLSVLPSHGQDCGTPAYQQNLRDQGNIRETDAQFEQWIHEQVMERQQLRRMGRLKSDSYRVQVVVHVIHNGEAVGSGTNISNAQVLSQIDVLNRDFKRQNTDAVNTPSAFLPVASGFDIEFVLATTDPNGMSTNGINRVRGSQTSWTREDDVLLKSQSYWPAENYINIWVCNLFGFRGYAQFPLSTLPGVEVQPTNRLLDGIVMGYRFFGSADFGNFPVLNPSFNKGRTASHEMGHFLGLRHIWGDEDNCTGTDYVDDTPPQAGSTSGCPVHPQVSCPTEAPQLKMFQNYMDFTQDACMNMFTRGQVDRMVIILESSPRRASLLIPLSPNPPDYEFEKIFSPNGDGINDFWRWTNTLKYDGCLLTVFNRFGKPVYQKTSYDNSWDGRTADGIVLEAGPYFFSMQCPGEKEFKGSVRLIR
jgi:gliding motility-associated-like protein